MPVPAREHPVLAETSESSKNDSEVWRTNPEQEMCQSYPVQFLGVTLERQILTEMFGRFYSRVSEEMKENIAQVRLEEIKTKVNKGEDLTCWEKVLRDLVGFLSPQNKLWKSGCGSTQSTGPPTRAGGEKQMSYDIKLCNIYDILQYAIY